MSEAYLGYGGAEEAKVVNRFMTSYPNSELHLTWAEIDLKALKYNFRQLNQFAALKTRTGQARSLELLAVVKADAYGHGMVPVALVLDRLGISYFGVSDVAEGKALRQAGIKKPILLFESTLPSLAGDIVDYRLTPTVCTQTLARALEQYAKARNKRQPVHVKVDTGMGRLGVWYQVAREFIREINHMNHLVVEGIYTHFPLADSDRGFTQNQVLKLDHLIHSLDFNADIVRYVHAANSMGFINYNMHHLNLARPGLMLYGLYPHPKLKTKIHLKPVMQVKSRIIFFKKVEKGCGVSYGHTFVAKRNIIVATLPIGYNDGYLRSVSNKARVLVKGVSCPVIGNVTMDQILVDVSEVKHVRLGEEVVLLGRQREREITADMIASWANTINYEVVCSLGNRLPRVYKGN